MTKGEDMVRQHDHNSYILCLHIIMHQIPVGTFIINPRRTCVARVTVVVLCVCLSVCLSVHDYSCTTGYEAAYEQY